MARQMAVQVWVKMKAKSEKNPVKMCETKQVYSNDDYYWNENKKKTLKIKTTNV